jgi:hypothetical protein
VTIAKSALHPSANVEVIFPEEQDMKTLDMADKYDSTPDPYEDDEPTIKMQVPIFHPQVAVKRETTYPGVGLLMVLGFGLIFWGTVGWLIFR